MFEDALLKEKQIKERVNVFVAPPYRSEPAIAQAVALAQHLATQKAVVGGIESWGMPHTLKLPNGSEEEVLLIPMGKWQALKKSMEE